MKKTLIKVLSSTIALTLVLASAGIAAAPTEKIPTDEIKAVKATATVQEVKAEEKEVKEDGVLAAIEAKVKAEAVAKVKEAKAPAVEIAKTAAAAEITAPKAEVKEEAKAAPEIKVAPAAEAEVEVEAPAVETVAPEAEAPVAEAEAPVVEATEAEPVKEWNISATEFDNVAMSFYAEPVAPASQVNIDTQSGVVRISGTGAMEENVYRHFMSKEKFLTAIEALFEAEYGVDVDLVYDDSITDVIELDYNLCYYAHDTGERLYITGNICDNLNPADFLEFSPSEIIIDEGITNVSNYAFLCCEGVETIVLPSTIETIGEYAFEYCKGLKTIVIPETAEIQENAFLYCTSLTNVQFYNAADNGGIAAQSDEGDTAVNALTPEEIHLLVYEW